MYYVFIGSETIYFTTDSVSLLIGLQDCCVLCCMCDFMMWGGYTALDSFYYVLFSYFYYMGGKGKGWQLEIQYFSKVNK